MEEAKLLAAELLLAAPSLLSAELEVGVELAAPSLLAEGEGRAVPAPEEEGRTVATSPPGHVAAETPGHIAAAMRAWAAEAAAPGVHAQHCVRPSRRPSLVPEEEAAAEAELGAEAGAGPRRR